MVGAQGLAVHLVGDQDLGRGIDCVGERERAHEPQVGLVGLWKDRLEVVGAVVGTLEPNLHAVRCRARPLQHLVEEGALPAGGRDRVVTPWLANRKWSHRETPVPCAFERDGQLNYRHRAQVVECERRRVLDRTADLERPIVGRHREVAADEMELRRRDLAS